MKRSTLLAGIVFSVVLCSVLALEGCSGSSVEGTYMNTNGSLVVELRSGGKAVMQLLGQSKDCTYKVNGKDIPLVCGSDQLKFHINDDGSLSTGSPLYGVLKKSK